jgi:arylsulfatase
MVSVPTQVHNQVWPILVNLRLDPFERTGLAASINYYDWYAYEFWRFVLVQQEVAKAAQTLVEFPPMQKGASFNMEAVKQQVEEAIRKQRGGN